MAIKAPCFLAALWQKIMARSKCRNRQAIRSREGPSSSLPKRWVVERTFAWLTRYRRLAKDWENLNRRGLAFLRLAVDQAHAEKAMQSEHDLSAWYVGKGQRHSTCAYSSTTKYFSFLRAEIPQPRSPGKHIRPTLAPRNRPRLAKNADIGNSEEICQTDLA